MLTCNKTVSPCQNQNTMLHHMLHITTVISDQKQSLLCRSQPHQALYRSQQELMQLLHCRPMGLVFVSNARSAQLQLKQLFHCTANMMSTYIGRNAFAALTDLQRLTYSKCDRMPPDLQHTSGAHATFVYKRMQCTRALLLAPITVTIHNKDTVIGVCRV